MDLNKKSGHFEVEVGRELFQKDLGVLFPFLVSAEVCYAQGFLQWKRG